MTPDRHALYEACVQASGDGVTATDPPTRHRADIVYAGNFSIGEWHTRGALLRYLRHVRARLEPGGVFVCDVYGGETAFLTGSTRREHRGPGGRTVVYTWEPRRADPLTGRVVCAIHFEVPPDPPLRSTSWSPGGPADDPVRQFGAASSCPPTSWRCLPHGGRAPGDRGRAAGIPPE